MTTSDTRNNRFEFIECARGLAALAVVLLHAGSMMSPEQYSGKVGLNGFFNFGKYGVDFFFVLSGFIIYIASAKNFNNSKTFLPFIIRRLFRIVPAYWFALAIGLLVNSHQRERVFLSTDFLTRQLFLMDNPMWLGPAWTLQFEFLFYFSFALGMLNFRIFQVFCVGWLAIIISRGVIYGGAGHDDLFNIISNPYCLLFWAGMAAARLQRIRLRVLAILFFVGLFLLLIGSRTGENYSELIFRLAIGILFGSLLIFALRFEGHGLKIPKAFLYLGSISYSLYITHVIFIGVTYAVFARIGLYAYTHEIWITLAAIFGCLVMASLIHRFIEVPFIGYGKRFESSLLKSSS